jgi:hypothetical protein
MSNFVPPMESATIEHDKVVHFISEHQKDRFEVLTNFNGEQNFIGNMYPDIILVDSISKQPVFVIEVKRNGEIARCIQQWQSFSRLPATLYIVVPESDLSTAKLVAATHGVNAKFGYYTYDPNTQNVLNLTYEQ